MGGGVVGNTLASHLSGAGFDSYLPVQSIDLICTKLVNKTFVNELSFYCVSFQFAQYANAYIDNGHSINLIACRDH